MILTKDTSALRRMFIEVGPLFDQPGFSSLQQTSNHRFRRRGFGRLIQQRQRLGACRADRGRRDATPRDRTSFFHQQGVAAATAARRQAVPDSEQGNSGCDLYGFRRPDTRPR